LYRPIGATGAIVQRDADAAEKLARKQVAAIPTQAGAYYIRGEQTEAVKQAESKVVSNKKRSILKAISPVPLVPGKATIELDGDHAPLRIADTRPEFYFRLSDYERFEIVKLSPTKKDRARGIAWRRAASSSMPGRGLRHGQASSSE